MYSTADEFGEGGVAGAFELNVAPRFQLHQNYPNPFNPATCIEFTTYTGSWIHLAVFNITGQHVSTLVDSYLMPGLHTVDFNASALPSGNYFYQLKTFDCSQTSVLVQRKMEFSGFSLSDKFKPLPFRFSVFSPLFTSFL